LKRPHYHSRWTIRDVKLGDWSDKILSRIEPHQSGTDMQRFEGYGRTVMMDTETVSETSDFHFGLMRLVPWRQRYKCPSKICILYSELTRLIIRDFITHVEHSQFKLVQKKIWNIRSCIRLIKDLGFITTSPFHFWRVQRLALKFRAIFVTRPVPPLNATWGKSRNIQHEIHSLNLP
jgi:hypothetical protein